MKKEQLPRKERLHLQHRAEILQAALELFSQKGYHNVSMQEIARQAEFSVGTIYKFFKNKEHLYHEIATQIVMQFYASLSKVLQADGDEYAKIKNYLRTKCHLFTENISAIRLYFRVSGLKIHINTKKGLEAELDALYRQLLQELTGVFKSGIQKKVFRSLDPYGLALALDSISDAFLFSWMEDSGKQNLDTNLIEKIFFEQVHLVRVRKVCLW